jgi:hypothetical protein
MSFVLAAVTKARWIGSVDYSSTMYVEWANNAMSGEVFTLCAYVVLIVRHAV